MWMWWVSDPAEKIYIHHSWAKKVSHFFKKGILQNDRLRGITCRAPRQPAIHQTQRLHSDVLSCQHWKTMLPVCIRSSKIAGAMVCLRPQRKKSRTRISDHVRFEDVAKWKDFTLTSFSSACCLTFCLTLCGSTGRLFVLENTHGHSFSFSSLAAGLSSWNSLLQSGENSASSRDTVPPRPGIWCVVLGETQAMIKKKPLCVYFSQTFKHRLKIGEAAHANLRQAAPNYAEWEWHVNLKVGSAEAINGWHEIKPAKHYKNIQGSVFPHIPPKTETLDHLGLTPIISRRGKALCRTHSSMCCILSQSQWSS